MDIEYSQEDNEFRNEVRTFVRDHYPEELKQRAALGLPTDRDVDLLWQIVLHKRGWAAPSWPKEYGGPGWTSIQRHIFFEELGAIGATKLLPFGLTMLAPILMEFGTRRQKDHFLPRILSGEDFWCQGYSEPGAGSDLASLQTRAERVDDEYVVNGTKVWTSFAHLANWIFCLVRTDPKAKKKQEGISFLLINLKTPGIAVRPIVMLDGTRDVNEVHFDNVKVPVENLVGEENLGWTYAKHLLTHERGGAADAARFKHTIKDLKATARKELAFGRPLLESEAFARKLAKVEIDLDAQEYLELRCLTGDLPQAAGSSIVKLRSSQIEQDISEVLLDAVGNFGFPFFDGKVSTDASPEDVAPPYARNAAAQFFNYRKTTIFGGTREIQKNILAKTFVGV
jgi:alkylation response protein AidB-like acyl-CoA dehydrogenase